MIDTIFAILLIIHVTGGTIGLLTGSINLIRRKGDKLHKTVGKIFTYSMLITGFCSLALSVIHPGFFLFIVGTFTIYLVGTGSRYIYLKLLGENQKPTLIDWTLTIAMLMTGSVFLILGLKQIYQAHYFGIVLVVFGIFSLRLVQWDFINYSGKAKAKNYWLLAHLQRMTGGYIAAFTAFLVVNSNNLPIALPAFVIWLAPTAVLTPLIVMWSRKYEVKKKEKTVISNNS